jgi:hypothetical protein
MFSSFQRISLESGGWYFRQNEGLRLLPNIFGCHFTYWKRGSYGITEDGLLIIISPSMFQKVE